MGETPAADQPGVYGTLGVPAATNVPGSRYPAATWVDNSGNFWLFGGQGFSSSTYGYLNDLWEFNPSTSQWTWMSGSNSTGQFGVYGTLGVAAAANTPGIRAGAAGWTDSSGNLWLFGGFEVESGIFLNDLWKFNPSTKEWTWMGGSSTTNQTGVYGWEGTPAAGNLPGSREYPVAWTDKNGNFWLFGGQGYSSTFNYPGYLNDLWEYNPSINEWTWISGSSITYCENCASSGGYGTLGVPGSGAPSGRLGASGWSDSKGNLWLFGGATPLSITQGNVTEQQYLNDLWEFTPSTEEWTWMSGSSTTGPNCSNINSVTSCGQAGVYGALGTAAAGSVPGGRLSATSWIDKSGNLWLFGGDGFDSKNDTPGNLNDLWVFNPSTQEWTWMDGSNVAGASSFFNGLGIAGATFTPGARFGASSWVDQSGNLWLFGGAESYESIVDGAFSDLWKYSPAATITSAPTAATPTFSVAAGTYATPQTVTISDTTAGATIYYTTNGTTPTTGSIVYSGPISVSSSETLSAIAAAPGYTSSAIASATYTLALPTAATPTFNVAAGTYATSQTVTISDTTAGATIYYTTNGTTPTTGSTIYSGPILVSSSETLSAIAAAPGYTSSAIASATYTLPAATPVFALPSGTYPSATVTITDTMPGATIYYTTDGTTPTTGSTVYSGSISVSTTETIEAIAKAANSTVSAVAMATYSISPTATAGEWAWMGGGSTSGPANGGGWPGVYGTLGTPASGNAPGSRNYAASWTDSSGNFWLFGGQGFDANGNEAYLNDLWEFNPANNQWVWMGGSSIIDQPGVYGSLGAPAAGNIPGSRRAAISWTDKSGNLWLFGGIGYDSAGTFDVLNDLWEFSPSTNLWAWMGGSSTTPTAFNGNGGNPGEYGTLGVPAAGNIPGSRQDSISWIDNSGNLWLFGGWGFDSTDTIGYLNDLWEFNPSTNLWAWMGGSSITGSKGGQDGVYGTSGVAAVGNIPGSRYIATSWTDNAGNLWLLGGWGFDSTGVISYLNDLWEFNPSTGLWAWMGGSSAIGSNEGMPGVYGTLGVAAAGNAPGGRGLASSWKDLSGNFWLFGGAGYDSTGASGALNDLWEFNPSTDVWVWMGGSNTVRTGGYGQYGVYGTLGVPAVGNVPGGRDSAVSWADTSGNLWLFGGDGENSTALVNWLNDLWVFQPSAGSVAAELHKGN